MKQRYLGNIQVLRGVASTMVVLAHGLDQFNNHPVSGMARLHDPTGVVWGSGVFIFFAISGFIMLYLTHDHFGERGYAAEFLKRRVIRVVPTYWIVTTLMVLAAVALPGRVNNGIASLPYVLASYLFIPMARADGVVHPILGLGWTLNYEFFFYAAFALVLLLPRRTGLPLLTACFVLLAAVHGSMPAGMLAFWSDPIILNFLAGLALAALFLRRVELRERTAIMLFLAGLAAMVLVPRLSMTEVPVMLAALPVTVAFVLSRERRWPRWALLIGDASYAIYLVHPFLLNATTLGWSRLHLPTISLVYLATMIAVALAGGIAFYKLVELPIMAVLRRRFEPRRAAVSA